MMSTGVCRWLFLLISLSTWTTITNSKEMRVVCYYTNWSVYRPGAAKFNPQNINPYLCTHLIYAFGGFTKENTLKPFDKYQDIEKGGYAKFTGLKTYNKNLKTMLAIGGWNEGSSRFSPMVASADRRKELVRNTIKFLRQNHFDGLDLDWEYPSFRDGGKPRDRDNYAQLVQELREEFERESEKTGRPRLLLTMAVPAGIEYINKGYDVPKLTKYLDWMNILSYDYHSAFEPAVNHHAPLFSLEEDNEYNYDAELNIDYTVKHYIKLGADPHKLVLGIPTYGRSYTLYNPDAYEIGSPADGPGDMGEATRENGYLAYYEICENIKNQDWAVEQPNPNAMGPYAYKDNQWVGYDDINIVQKKSEYVAENELGGIMFWAIDNDDFRGNCDGKPYPLIEAAKEALINAYGLTDDNLISPPSKPKSRTRSRTKGIGKTKADEEETKPEKISSLSGSRRRNRLKSKNKEEQRDNISTRQKHRRKELRGTTEAATTHSSLKLVTPSYTTPAPPSTPDLDGAFKCEDEGFFPHPKDCKKYFWCLSGAGDSGIVAHQFTCPAGLYFNKAADSCDYSQNVLCNKKLQKPTTTTSSPSAVSTATTTTPTSIVISTSRAPPKITAATSRTTFKVSTTTESIDDEYEYEGDDEEDEEEDDKGKVDSEEDPQVIKELIDLIKKAGGLEELERQLSGSKTDPTSASTDSTTPSAISKSLYERVLNKAVKNSLNAKKNPLLAFRNSRGPQNDGTSKKDETSSSKSDRGKLQYTSISRKRPTTEKSNDDDKDNEEEIEEVKEDNAKIRRTFSNKKYQPEYVTIRRPRVSTTTEFSESESSLDRNKILGESSDEEYEDDDDDEEDNEDEVEENEPNKKSYTPQYVNIRRQRPSTTEESTTSKYTVIRRGSTSANESAIEVNEETTTSKYKPIRRGSTPSASTTTEQDSSSKYQLRRGTTSQTSTTPSALSDGATSRFKNFRRGSTTPKPATEAENKATVTSTEASVTIPIDDENYVSPSARIVTSSSTETSTTSEFPISTNATTIQSNPEVITTTLPSIINISQTSTSATGTTTPVVDDDKITTLANDIDDKSVVDSNTNGNEKELQDLTKTENVTETPEKSTTATVTDNETDTSQKNNPQLLNPRPLSTFSRGSGSTLKPITEPTIHNSKVSQSNFKFRLRPKISNVVDVSNIQPSTTSESPAPKGNSRFKSRGNSRFTSSNQNVNFNDNEENNEDANANIKIRKRVSTTERYLDENRTYRPSELADLSSLTAVDFAKIKELNFGRATHRRRVRPNTSSTTESSTDIPDDEFADESLKTSSRTLPLARKLVETSSFGQSKRNLPNRTDQINSSSEVNITRKRIRGFGTRTTRQSSTTENYDVISNNNENTTSDTVNITPRSRRVVRRFRTTTSKSVPNKETDVNSKSVETQTVRRRSFIIKKENQTITNNNSTNAAPTLNKNKQNALQRLFNKKPTRLPFIIQKNNVDEDNDDSEEDSSTEEGENIKLSESNIRENSDVNSYDIGGKLNRRPFKLIRTKSDILHGKSNVGKEGIEKTIQTTTKKEPVINENNSEKYIKKGDNIEPNISTENNTEPISTEADTETNITNLETTTEYIAVTLKKNREIKASTQPSIGRTRKIIRKIKPTTTTVTPPTTTTEPITGRKRKIIRRLRPVSGSKQNLEIKSELYNQTRLSQPVIINNQTEKEIETKHVFRPTITRHKSKYTAPDLEKQAETTGDLKSPVRIALRKLPSRNSNRNQQRLNSNQNITEPTTNSDEDFAKRIFRPKLSDIKNKYKNLDSSRTESGVNTKRIAFKPFVRSTTTVQNQEVIDITTESFVNKTDLASESKSHLEETTKAVLFEPIETTTTVNKEEIESFTESLENKLNSEKILDGIENDNTEHPDIIKSDSEEDLETVSTIPLEISTTENSNKEDFENTTSNLKYNISSEEKAVNEQEQNNEEHLEEVNSTTEQLRREPLKSFARSTTTIRDENVIETSTESLKDVSKLEQEYLDKIKSETELQNEQSFPFKIPTTTENNERVTESTTEILGNKINAEQKVTLEEKNNKEPFEKNKSRTQQILKRVPYKSLLRSTTPANSKTVLDSATERSRNESLQKSKPKPEQFANRIKSFKPFFRSTTTTTVANKEIIETATEVLRDESNLEQKNANDEVISTTDAIQINSILTEQNDDKKESYNESTETTNFADYTTIRATENNTVNYLDDKDIQNTTIEENLANTTEDVTQTSDKTESYKEFAEAPLSDTVSTVSEEDSFEMRSSTTLYNMETFPSSTVRNDELDNDDEDTATESNGDRRRNYITVFRSSTTSNSFKNFNSENDNEAPKFDELFEDKDKEDKYKELYEEDTKFGDYKGFDGYHFGNHDDNNDEDEYYKYDDDTLIGDTSTEYRNELSYTPNDIVTEEEEKTVQPTETSSKRNHFYHPNRPSFIRPKISISTTERQTLQRPNYKTFARTTLRKEIIQIHSFNNTNEDGSPEKSVNKVLFTNRYKYKTLERTTSAPETVDTISEDILSFEKDTIPENTTPELQTINTEENLITTKNTETKSIEDDISEDGNLTETTLNDESVTITNLFDATTEISTNNIEEETNLSAANTESATIEIETITDNSLPQTEPDLSTAEITTTESFNESEQSADNSKLISTISTENMLETTDVTTNMPFTGDDLIISDTNQTSSESTTTILPETTTPYRRRSTLRPINSRPKFTPAKRKISYTASSTAEQRADDSKQKSKFYRNRYQKSTTETSNISASSNTLEKDSAPLPINKYLYKQSTTKQPIATEESNIKTLDDVSTVEKINYDLTKYDSALNTTIDTVLTTAVPLSKFILEHSKMKKAEKVEYGNNENNDYEEDNAEKYDDLNEYEENEEDLDEDLKDKEIEISSVRPQLTKPKPSKVSNTPSGNRRSNSPIRSNSPLYVGRSTTSRVVNKPVFARTTENSKIPEDLSDIDTEAIKNRNKNLFSKQRKVNSPLNAVSEKDSETELHSTTTDSSLESVTGSQEFITLSPSTTESTSTTNVDETTEYLTTLHHIFAEVNNNETMNDTETTTEAVNSITSTTGKMERLLEVNRIVQIKTKEAKVKNHIVGEQTTAEIVKPVVNKIGEISRVTVIKVVDGNDTIIETVNSLENEIKQTDPISPVYISEEITTKKQETSHPELTYVEIPATVEEVPAPSILDKINVTNITVTIDKIPELLHTYREDRKFEIFNRPNDLSDINQIVPDKKTEIVEGTSHINVITPRPGFTEASTIALEGLFQSEPTKSPVPVNNVAPNEELLEMEHSKFVNVRVLHPDQSFGKEERDYSKRIPIKLLKQDTEEVTLKAEVVEIKPHNSLDSIKIVPIKVEMSRKISDNLPVFRVTPQDIYTTV